MGSWNDLRFSIRSLLREPAFAIIAVLTIALGVGANTAIFSVVNGVLLRPLPYEEPGRLVLLQESVPEWAHMYPVLPVSARHFTEWRQRASTLERLSAFDIRKLSITGSGQPEQTPVVRASADFFETLGVRPALGRGFVKGEDTAGRERVVVLSDSLWRRRFHADPGILGKTVIVGAQNHTVVGVLSPSFRFPAAKAFDIGGTIPEHPDVFKPLVFRKDELDQQVGNHNYLVVARLKPGVSSDRTLAEMNVIASQLMKEAGEETIHLKGYISPLDDAIVGKSRTGLLVLLGAVGAVLLIVCVNLANLALARGERRSREAAIRTALGASGRRLMLQPLMESLLVAITGGVLGVAVAASMLGLLVRVAPANIPRLAEVHVDARVLAFAFLITAASGILFGLAPAWHAMRTDPQSALKSGGRTATESRSPLRASLVAAEVALSVVLLATAGLMMGSFMRLMRTDKGFQAPTVLAADISIPVATYKEDEQRNSFHRQLLDKLAAEPGVVSAAVSTMIPLQGETWIDSFHVPEDTRPPQNGPMMNVRFVSGDYFTTMGIPLRAGRSISDADRKRSVIVISERAAEVFWPGQREVVGRKVLRGGDAQVFEVIGVARDARADVNKPAPAIVYRPYWDWAPPAVTVVARAAGDPWTAAGAIRAAVRAVDRDVPIASMRTMQQVLEESVAERRFQMLLACVFAGTALFLAALGIYGVVSYSVTRRTNEMGVRMALGAQAGNLYGMILRQAMLPVIAGLVAGLSGALAAGRVLASLLYEISPRDPATLAAVAVTLAGVALAACFVPARRAARVDPLVALRYE